MSGATEHSQRETEQLRERNRDLRAENECFRRLLVAVLSGWRPAINESIRQALGLKQTAAGGVRRADQDRSHRDRI